MPTLASVSTRLPSETCGFTRFAWSYGDLESLRRVSARFLLRAFSTSSRSACCNLQEFQTRRRRFGHYINGISRPFLELAHGKRTARQRAALHPPDRRNPVSQDLRDQEHRHGPLVWECAGGFFTRPRRMLSRRLFSGSSARQVGFAGKPTSPTGSSFSSAADLSG